MNNLRAAREQAGLSQKEVSIELKVSAPTVSEWESGKKNPNAKNLKQLAYLYGATTDYLLGTNGMLGAYIRQRRGNKSVEDFAKECGISTYLLNGIENGFESTSSRGGNADRQTCLGTDDLMTLAAGLNVAVGDDEKVDFWYLACLYGGINPHCVHGISIPADDLTKNLPEVGAGLRWLTIKSAPPVEGKALKITKRYNDLDDDGKGAVEAILDYEESRKKVTEVPYAARESDESHIQTALAARGGKTVKAPSPVSEETLNRLDAATREAADAENSQF